MCKLFKTIQVLLDGINRVMLLLGSIALGAAALILSYSVVSRALFNLPTDWEDEAAVFCLVGVTFLCSAYVQHKRGHIGISAIANSLPRSIEQLRTFLIDALSFLFCGFFSWKSWTLWHEAWVDGYVTSSSWGPPLSIPYGMMALGMTLLSLQLFVQTLGHICPSAKGR
jgi:TRAP-type C4-dicarboxylate transport system permease small subunit